MRLEIPLTLIIIALVLLGGLIVDEYNIRNEYNALNDQINQLQEALQASNEQVKRLTDQLQISKDQTTQCISENNALTQMVTDLQAEINRLKADNELLQATGSLDNRLVGPSLAGALGLSTLCGGIWTAKRITLRRRSPARIGRAEARLNYYRRSEAGSQTPIQQHRRMK